MHNKIAPPFLFLIAIILIVGLACNLPGAAQPTALPPSPEQALQVVEVTSTSPPPTETLFSGESNLPDIPTATFTPVITHVDLPLNEVKQGALVFDVESSGTAPEKRAPYGDSYDIYRMERPFTQDMTYIPDMDIVTYNVQITDEWIYVSIQLIGNEPNNEMGIHYGVELDLNGDGFGEYIIWSNPPYTAEWSTNGVQVFADDNHDTGGLSAALSDAPLDGDGYETKIFDSGTGDDPDLAWVRAYAGRQATIQFAFKKSLSGASFLLGVLADAGLRDVSQMYYNDRFTEDEAGSPEKNEKEYPLKALYAFDNACREAYNYNAIGYEPLLCPRDEPTPGARNTGGGCQNPSQYTDAGSCTAAGCAWVPDPNVVVAVVYHCVAP